MSSFVSLILFDVSCPFLLLPLSLKPPVAAAGNAHLSRKCFFFFFQGGPASANGSFALNVGQARNPTIH